MTLPFELDAHGRLVPRGDETRRALADRAGRFLLLPSAPDLLVARRSPAAGGALEGPRCVLAGDLSAFPIADFLGFLHTARLGGTLTVSAGGVDRAVALREGEVRGAHSEARGERIGEVALRLGYLGPAQLDEALAAGNGRHLGKVLVEKGFVSTSDLWKCFREQVTSVFHGILTAREGVFALVDQSDLELPGMPLGVNTQQLLMDGIRRIDEMGLFRSRIPGPQVYLRRREPRRPVALQPLEQQLLALADGRRTVADLARESHLSEFDATKVLYHLTEIGYLEVADQAAATPAARRGLPRERLAALVREMNAVYREVAVHVAAARALDPFLAAERTFLADAAGRFAPLWKGLAPARDATLDAERLLANAAQLQGAAGDVDVAHGLFEGMRELLFFLLFAAGERLDRGADEALSAEVKRRLEAIGEPR
ncbi:MAG TPA: DUF4388 domain-containing protein [Anaeromyxobacteraceae bacterium]